MLTELFEKEEVISPDLPLSPLAAFDICSQILISRPEESFLVGSSLGGFYAYCLANKFRIPCLLINPSLTPFVSLVGSIGEVTNFVTGK